jgi:hypothetical protein
MRLNHAFWLDAFSCFERRDSSNLVCILKNIYILGCHARSRSWAVLLNEDNLAAAAARFTPAALASTHGLCGVPDRLTVTLLDGGGTFFPPRQAR